MSAEDLPDLMGFEMVRSPEGASDAPEDVSENFTPMDASTPVEGHSDAPEINPSDHLGRDVEAGLVSIARAPDPPHHHYQEDNDDDDGEAFLLATAPSEQEDSFSLLEQTQSDVTEDLTGVCKVQPPPQTEKISTGLVPMTMKTRSRSPCNTICTSLPAFLFLLLLIIVPLTLLLVCVVTPDSCVLPGDCPGHTLRHHLDSTVRAFYRARMPPPPI